MKSYHNAAPWELKNSSIQFPFITIFKGRNTIAQIPVVGDSLGNYIDYQRDYANAYLIKAAPNMFEVIEFLMKSFPDLDSDESIEAADVLEHLANHWQTIVNVYKEAKGEIKNADNQL